MSIFKHCTKCSSCCVCLNKKKDRQASVVQAERDMAAHSDEKVNLEEFLKPLPKYLPLTFLPDVVVEKIAHNRIDSVPYSDSSESVILMCDVCNFTRLTESYCEKGVSGIEELASIMNGYMTTLSGMMLYSDGDILSFAGDAFLVQWVLPEDPEERQKIICKAYSCALNLQAHPSLEQKNLDGKLHCKIGLAVGEVTTWVLGTWEQSLLFVVSGSGLQDVHSAEALCVARDIVVSHPFFQVLQEAGVDTFTVTELLDGYFKINEYHVDKTEEELVPMRVVSFQECNDSHLATANVYLIPSIRQVKTSEELSYLSEMTPVTIVFINLPEVDVGNPTVLDMTFGIVLASVSKQGGCINKMLLFDKGCSFLVVFGLPGMKNPNDAARALICAHDIVVKHELLNLTISTGVASGTCYCGLVGHSQRQEYTVIGATVNLAARLMQVYIDDPIALDENTFHLSRDILGDQCFHELPPRKLKGVSKGIKIYGCKIVKEKVKRTRSSIGDLIVGEEAGEEEPFFGQVHDCLAQLVDPEQRFQIQESTLLPVLVFETRGGSANSYFTFLASCVANRLGLRVVSSCTYVATVSNPFSTAAYMVMKMLGFEAKETPAQKEEKLLAVIPRKWDEHLYLLNHILEVGFPYPRFASIDKESRDAWTFKILLAIFNKYAEDDSVVLAVDDVDSMDDCSWRLFQALSEGERYVLVLNIHPEFTQLTASVLVLKAHKHIDVRSVTAMHFDSLVCWHLGAHAVSRVLINYVREKTAGNTQLLGEVLLLPTLAKATDLLHVDPHTFDLRGFHVSGFYSKEDSPDQILVIDLKPGYALEDLLIPPNINDAVQTALNHLSMQDRLLLKRAAILGSVFDLHMLEGISTGLSSHEVVSSINSLIGMHILCATCTSPGMLYSVDRSAEVAVTQHHICLCSKISRQSPFYDMRNGLGHVSAYQRLKFRSRVFRDTILSYMTSEQFRKMHVEAVNDLETGGIICRSCKNRRLESLSEEKFDMRAAAVQVNLAQCYCLQLRPHLFNRICFMYKKIGHHLLPAYYKKKAAQASNDLGYPIAGLIFIEKAEKFLGEDIPNNDPNGENVFDPVALRISMYKTAAKSAILLKNYYYAASFVEKALNILKMGTVWFYGLYTEHSFQRVLKNLPLLRAEAVTKLTDVLAESYVLAEKHDLALNILKFEFVALTYYPIDFLQMLNYMNLLYISLTQTQPGKQFHVLEQNLLATIHKRLQSHEVMLNVLEIRGIGKAFVTLIVNSISKNNLSYAEEIGIESMGFLTALKDEKHTADILVYLTELVIHQKNYEKGFQLLQKMSEFGSDPNSPKVIYYTLALSTILMQKVEAEGKSIDDDGYVISLNKFVATWTDRRIFYLTKDELLHSTAHFALWALNSAKHYGWLEAQGAFRKCYAMCRNLLQNQEQLTYFTVGGALVYCRVKIMSKQAERDPTATLEELEKFRTLIKKDFPVYLERYQCLKQEISALVAELQARDRENGNNQTS